MGFLDQLGESGRTVVGDAMDVLRTVVDGAGWPGEPVRSAVDLAAEVWHGVTDPHPATDTFGGTQAMSVEELVAIIRIGPGTHVWHHRAGVVTRMAERHSALSSELTALVDELRHAWTGRAADAAGARIRPLIIATRTASDTLAANASYLGNTAGVFDEVKPRIEDLPARPHQNLMDVISPYDTDTEQAVHAYNDAAQRNLDLYRGYQSAMNDDRGSLRYDYGRLDDYGGGEVTLDAAAPGTHAAEPSTPGFHRARPPEPGVEAHATASAAPPQHSPGRAPSDPATPDAHQDVRAPIGGAAAEPGAIGPVTGTATGATTAAAAAGPVGVSGPVATAGPAEPPGSVARDTVALGGGGGRAADSVPGARGAAQGGAALRAAERAVERSATGGVGPRGNVGASGIAGAGHGARDEEREHKRRYGTADDSVFAAADAAAGGKLVDPHSGLRVTPATIGSERVVRIRPA